MDKVFVIGSSGHAKVVIDACELQGRYDIIGLIDDFRLPGEEIHGYEILGSIDDFTSLLAEHAGAGVVVAIGDNFQRSNVVEKLQNIHPALNFVSIVHPGSVIARSATIGQGVVILAGVILNAGATVEDYCILNTGASLDHDSLMQKFSSIAPGVVIGGDVRVGVCSSIGLGAGVIQKVIVGDYCVIGAGSTVLGDVADLSLAYGVPCRVIRRRPKNERYL